MAAAVDVVVLGAGIVGVSAALHLQARGRSVVIVDRLGTIAEYLGHFADGARNSAKNLEKRIEALEKENKELKDKLLCNLCFKNEPDTFLYVCKHRFCEPCVKILNEGDPPLCPVCRKVMKTYERLF